MREQQELLITKYIFNTARKHKNKIDADQMREHPSVLKAENAPKHIYWFLYR